MRVSCYSLLVGDGHSLYTSSLGPSSKSSGKSMLRSPPCHSACRTKQGSLEIREIFPSILEQTKMSSHLLLQTVTPQLDRPAVWIGHDNQFFLQYYISDVGWQGVQPRSLAWLHRKKGRSTNQIPKGHYIENRMDRSPTPYCAPSYSERI